MYYGLFKKYIHICIPEEVGRDRERPEHSRFHNMIGGKYIANRSLIRSRATIYLSGNWTETFEFPDPQIEPRASCSQRRHRVTKLQKLKLPVWLKKNKIAIYRNTWSTRRHLSKIKKECCHFELHIHYNVGIR